MNVTLPDFKKFDFSSLGIDVSRETAEKFDIYASLLLKWQRTINLVGASTLPDMAMRHFVDSAQLMKLIPDKNVTLADMGSGAGFPGMILAMMGVEKVHLIESDIRKATFLHEVALKTGTKLRIHDERVEDCKIHGIQVFTARALAPLRELLNYAYKLSTPGVDFYCLFQRGATVNEEIKKTNNRGFCDIESFSSVTEKEAKILKISNFDLPH